MDEVWKLLVQEHPELAGCQADLAAAGHVVVEALRAGRTLFTCGNGGSAADSEHLAGELIKAFALPRPVPAAFQAQLHARFGLAGDELAKRLQQGLAAIPLTTGGAGATAISNDLGGDLVFAQQVMALGRAGDVVLGISTSGQAANVCQAMRVAVVKGMRTIGLTGLSGGRLNELCEIVVRAPGRDTAEIQERHVILYHALCRSVEKFFFA